MAIADDISVALNGDIRYTGTTINYTVLALHRFLQDLADNLTAVGDDLISIIDTDPSDRATDRIITLLPPYNIDDTLAQSLYDGSISQDSGNTEYSGLVVVGRKPVASVLMIVQDNALLTDYWGNSYNPDAAQNILYRLLIKTRVGAADIDGKKVRLMLRDIGDTYSEFALTLGLGNSTAALFTESDLNNQTAAATIALWTDILNTEGYQLYDADLNGSVEEYYSRWVTASRSLNDLYERSKWLTRRGSTSSLHGMNGQLFRGITDEWVVGTVTGGPFTENEIITWTTNGTGEAVLVAYDDNGANGGMWLQLTKGNLPSSLDVVTGASSGATGVVSGVVNRTVSSVFLGITTGSNIIGAFGLGIEPTDIGSGDTLTDLMNLTHTPPNNVTFDVKGLVVGEDRVLVAPEAGGGGIQENQFTVNGIHVAASTILTINETPPADQPASGVLRVYDDGGFSGGSPTTFKRVPYSSFTGSLFTLTGTLGVDLNGGGNVYTAFIDRLAVATVESFTITYNADRNLFVRSRNGSSVAPTKDFEASAVLGSAGGSATVVRIPD